MHVKHSSGLIPLVSKEIAEIKEPSPHATDNGERKCCCWRRKFMHLEEFRVSLIPASMASSAVISQPRSSKTESYVDNKCKEDIRQENITTTCAVTDVIRTNLGPKVMDKMISTTNSEVIITNGGATILNKMKVLQPAAKMLVELSKSHDAAAGDGSTIVVVIAGALLKQC
ncbi:hypothetical protein C1H46_042758 [Malus baccata]|uniref:T-complex protein 1 subunit delta n=1 Tax=Malus baccata TaxID=106549 RepID=A0A540KBV4_MALBA|nr:hypothetical protein C1H46_042758 [Malus baccata]